MFDVITLGTATKDIFIKADNIRSSNNYLILELGRKLDIQVPFIETGGGATNTAVSFSRLGLKTAAITKIGKDEPGHLIKRLLLKENVDTKFVMEDKKEGTAISTILVKKGKDAAVLVYRGASENLKLDDIKLKELKTKWLYVSALKGKSIKVLKNVLKYCKKHNIKVAMNPGSKELEMPYLLKYVDVLLLNLEEAKKLSGKTHLNEILHKLNEYGLKIIAITSGKHPVFVSYYNSLLYAEPLDVKVVSTIGAGDAFCSAFVTSLIYNKSIDYAIRAGLLNSAAVIQKFGAKNGLLKLEDLKKHEQKPRYIHIKTLSL